MKLVVCISKSPVWESIKSFLSNLGSLGDKAAEYTLIEDFVESRTIPDYLTASAQSKTSEQVEEVFVFYEQIEHSLSHALLIDNQEFESACERCVFAVNELLQIHASNRSKVRLINLYHLKNCVEQMRSSSQSIENNASAQHLSNLFNLPQDKLELLINEHCSGSYQKIENDQFELIFTLVHQWVNNSPELQQLNKKLFISSQPLIDKPLLPNIKEEINNVLVTPVVVKKEQTQAEAGPDNTNGEYELMVLQLNQIQEELEYYFVEKSKLEVELKLLQENQRKLNEITEHRLKKYRESETLLKNQAEQLRLELSRYQEQSIYQA